MENITYQTEFKNSDIKYLTRRDLIEIFWVFNHVEQVEEMLREIIILRKDMVSTLVRWYKLRLKEWRPDISKQERDRLGKENREREIMALKGIKMMRGCKMINEYVRGVCIFPETFLIPEVNRRSYSAT